AAQDLHVQHVRQHDVVHVVASAADEPVVLDPFAARAESTDLDFVQRPGHDDAPFWDCSFLAAQSTDLTMFWYPVQRHKLPDSAQRTSSSVGSGFSSSRALAASIMPGVQKPHCKPCSCLKPSWIGCSSLAVARPSTVVTSCPLAWMASIVQLLIAVPSSSTVQAPQFDVSHPVCVPVSLKPYRSRWASNRRGSTSAARFSPLTVIVTR